jgi:hypothetical protein
MVKKYRAISYRKNIKMPDKANLYSMPLMPLKVGNKWILSM